jgi:hypothetical protein
MNDTWQATPGKGIGNILFGIDKSRLIELLGEPDALDENEEDGEICEHYYYDDLDIAFTYSSAEGDRLLVITIGNPQYLVADKLFTGMDMHEALKAIEELGWEEPQIERVEKDNLIYAYGDTGVDVWFEDGLLTGFQMTPQWKDDDTIAWPTQQ